MSNSYTVQSLLQELQRDMIFYAGGAVPRKKLRRRVRTLTERTGVPANVARVFSEAVNAQLQLIDNLRMNGALPAVKTDNGV